MVGLPISGECTVTVWWDYPSVVSIQLLYGEDYPSVVSAQLLYGEDYPSVVSAQLLYGGITHQW